MVYLYIPKPALVEIYYTTCIYVQQNNQRSCDDLNLKKKLYTHSWDRHVNMSIFRVSVVDTYNVATQYLAYEGTSSVLLCALDEEMIYNNMDSGSTDWHGREL